MLSNRRRRRRLPFIIDVCRCRKFNKIEKIFRNKKIKNTLFFFLNNITPLKLFVKTVGEFLFLFLKCNEEIKIKNNFLSF